MEPRDRVALLLTQRAFCEIWREDLEKARLPEFRRAVHACERCAVGTFRDSTHYRFNQNLCPACEQRVSEKDQEAAVYATTAIQCFHLKKRHLVGIPHQLTENPHVADGVARVYPTQAIVNKCIEVHGSWRAYWNMVAAKHARCRRRRAHFL